jgi:hypothetical protein
MGPNNQPRIHADDTNLKKPFNPTFLLFERDPRLFAQIRG